MLSVTMPIPALPVMVLFQQSLHVFLWFQGFAIVWKMHVHLLFVHRGPTSFENEKIP